MTTSTSHHRNVDSSSSHFVGILAGVGLVALLVALLWEENATARAASQDWPPFVLVLGLLLVGMVAEGDGLFAAAGHRLARASRGNGVVLFVGVTVLVGVVTATMNLDTSVAFLTPVLVYAARSRGGGEALLLYGCLLLSNAGSLFLTGSNLTNLIVLAHLHLSGREFLARMWAPAIAALVVTAVVVALFEHEGLRQKNEQPSPSKRPVFGLGLLAIVVATLLVILLRSPALPVAGVGVIASGLRVATGKRRLRQAIEVVGPLTLVALFEVAVVLGALGRVWSGPSVLLSHLDVAGTAVIAAIASVLVNNLPAASLLSSRAPTHPFALLIGLNLGPNLFVSGSLAWLLWLRSACGAGAEPSIWRTSRIGVVAVPLSMAAAVAALTLTGAH